MCHQNSCVLVSVEEAGAAEECLLVYCKPVELYNILLRRAQHNPSFLSRCLKYKVQARKKRRLSNENVIFNYKDGNNLFRKSEVTREFSCPFCLMRCASFKPMKIKSSFKFLKMSRTLWPSLSLSDSGLRSHLTSTHDLFQFEFWVSEEYQAVNVSVKVDDLQSEVNTDGIDPQLQSYCLLSKPLKRRRVENPLDNARNVHLFVVEPDWVLNNGENTLGSIRKDEAEEAHGSSHIELELPDSKSGEQNNQPETRGAKCAEPALDGLDPVGIPVARAQSFEDTDCIQIVSSDQASLLQNAKTKKVFMERADLKNGALLQKRQFYHSHRAQPMAMDQVLADRDSEDEIDYTISGLEDRRMLDDFVDVTKDEKHLMHLWNSFVRKQRVLADGHVSWACEAFLQLHGQDLVQNPALFWCWRLFMIKLWNHGLLDANIMNHCSVILQKYQDEAAENNKSAVDKD